jgi:hypothetical protein
MRCPRESQRDASNLLIRRIGVDWVHHFCELESPYGASLCEILSKDFKDCSCGALSQGRFVRLQPTASYGVVIEGDHRV